MVEINRNEIVLISKCSLSNSPTKVAVRLQLIMPCEWKIVRSTIEPRISVLYLKKEGRNAIMFWSIKDFLWHDKYIIKFHNKCCNKQPHKFNFSAFFNIFTDMLFKVLKKKVQTTIISDKLKKKCCHLKTNQNM